MDTKSLGNSEYLTFTCIEFHAPCISPAFQGLQVTLKGDLVLYRMNGPVHEAIISEQTDLGANDGRKVINKKQKQ